ncbi:MAG: ATP-dependent sacrificial sulfur transferase LarE [Clostridia bacterium]|nr:ATP-dependent sacrificial sulfur transferase LarE [Clostridia bacterium]
MELDIKYNKLLDYIKSLKSVVVAYSGGVDSTFLLKASKEALGDKVIAVTISSCLNPSREMDDANSFCKNEGIKQVVCEVDPFLVEGFCENPKNRCYICKKNILTHIRHIADKYSMCEVMEGSNLDDMGDYRPGMQAVKELGIKSPLKDMGFSKSEIRELSKKMGLPTWKKPSFACLASRIPYGDRITKEKLERVEKAEDVLFNMGFLQFRVRVHNDIARIEVVPDNLIKVIENRDKIIAEFKKLGFLYITLDIEGYRTGSLNTDI